MTGYQTMPESSNASVSALVGVGPGSGARSQTRKR